MNFMIELSGVTKVYRMGEMDVQALRGIDMEIAEGEMAAIEGPSGSGKSTLLSIIGCLDAPTGGRYRLAGVDVGELDDDELARFRSEHIGFVFQSYHLLPRLTARENVETPLIYRGTPRGDRKSLADRALEEVGLADRADHQPSELSGGESQRVAIARALVGNPKLLLADEPTGNLDRQTGKDIMEIITRLNKERGLTAIVVTHDPEIAALCSRRIQIRDGRIDGRYGMQGL